MTTFGAYLLIVYGFGILANMYYAGKGGTTMGPGVLLFSAVWAMFNLIGILLWGTGFGIF